MSSMKTETLGPGLDAAPTDAARAGRLPRTIAVLVFAVLTAVAARIAVPLPGTAVPFTLQVLAVLVSGLVLGPTRSARENRVH